MASSARVAGVCFLKVDGVQYALRGSLSINPTLFMREGIAGQDSVHGYKETPMVPSIEGDITDLGGLSIKALLTLKESTITAELSNGKVYILVRAWFAGEAKIDTAEGKVPVKFEGFDCREITA